MALQSQDAVALDAQVEQALVAQGGGGQVGAHDGLVLELRLAGQEQTVVQHHAAVPLGGVQQDQMPVGGLQHQGAVAGVFRLDGSLVGDGGPQSLAEEIAHALDAGGGVDVARHPVHGTGLGGHVALAQVADHLTLADVHLVAVVGHSGGLGRDGQIPLVLDDGEGALPVQDADVVVVGKVVDLDHGKISFLLVCL